MVPEITLHRQYESGSIYEFRDKAVFVPAGVTEQVEVDIETDENAVLAADSPHRDTPDGVVGFEDDGRNTLTRAELWAIIHDRIDVTEPLKWHEPLSDDCERTRIPVIVAADRKAMMAAFLASYGFENDEIGNALGVGQRTVVQYISDFKKGER